MPTLKQFEQALTARGVCLRRVKLTAEGVSQAEGTLTKSYTWDSRGRCFHRGKRVPRMDINFTKLRTDD